jgi:hypothetical protein
MAQHDLGDIDIRDHAILEWSYRHDAFRRTAEHALRFQPNALDALGAALDGYHRRLVEDNALALYVDERVGGAQIDRDVVDGQQTPGTQKIL